MKPRMRPSSNTWGKIAIRRGISIGRTRKGKGHQDPSPSPGRRVKLLLQGWRRDVFPLQELVVIPLGGILGADLKDEVPGLLAVALPIELDLPREAGVLDLSHLFRHR